MQKIILSILILLPGMVQAQYGYITGKVYDRFGPIANAPVYIQDSPYGSFTNDQGYFAFEIDTGYYQLVVELTGYAKEVRNIELNNLERKELDLELSNNLLDANVSIGTKSIESQKLMESPVPIDLILGEDLLNTGEVELGPALHQILPNFYSVKQSADDGVNMIDPVSLRGLGPDQLLVLINGKRRHKSAFLNVSDVFGKGTAGPDLNAIPILSIEKIEILRDGASSQYGSDAIAGVMNIILKERTSNSISTNIGVSERGDGLRKSLSINSGFQFNRKSFVNLTGSYLQEGAVNVAGDYTGPIFGVDSLDSDPASVQSFFDQSGFPNRTLAELGSSAFEYGGLFLNSNFQLTQDYDFYMFGGLSQKTGEINQVYRLPFEEQRVANGWYPLGFSPTLIPISSDQSLVVGFRGSYNGWYLDTSFGVGSNSMDMNVENTNNASYGPLTPLNAYSGGYEYSQKILSFDATRNYEAFEHKWNLSLGGEYRIEEYALLAGETVSYENGGDTTMLGELRESGIQGYPGISAEDALRKQRTNASAYLEMDYAYRKFKVSAALRQEEYSDFGSQTNYKAALSYKLTNQFIFRVSYSTGFKAPSLPQMYYQRVSDVNTREGFSTVAIVNTQTEFLGNLLTNADALNPELSQSISFGFSCAFNRNIFFTVDAYRTDVSSRIGLTSRVDVNSDPFLREVFEDSEIDYLQVFANIMSTRNNGIDAVLSAQQFLGKTLIKLDSRFSVLRSVITSYERNEELEARQTGLDPIERSDQGIIESYVPSYKWRNSVSATWNKVQLNMTHTLFGETKYLHPLEGEVMNEFSGELETRDQIFSLKNIFNTNIKYRIYSQSTISIGCNNLTNQFPDKMAHSENVLYGMNVYSQNVRPFDLKGRYVYIKLDFVL